jgi:hypothetical protein
MCTCLLLEVLERLKLVCLQDLARREWNHGEYVARWGPAPQSQAVDAVQTAMRNGRDAVVSQMDARRVFVKARSIAVHAVTCLRATRSWRAPAAHAGSSTRRTC